jgi:hypothetical protein
MKNEVGAADESTSDQNRSGENTGLLQVTTYSAAVAHAN